MSNATSITTLFNLAGAVAVLVVGGYTIHTYTVDERPAPCMQSYPPALHLAVSYPDGAPMTPSEFQGRLGVDEWGVIENVRIVKTKSASANLIEVRLPKGSSSAYQDRAPRGGTGFTWTPDKLKGATAACLSYRVHWPKDFEFSGPGLLPGLFGGETRMSSLAETGASGFSTRIAWNKGGNAAMVSAQAPAGRGVGRARNATEFKFEKGGWHRVTTEVVMNKPGKSDGVLRLWVDGDLKLERTDVVWRKSEDIAITGVAADISYGGLESASAAPKDEKIHLSPFEISWKK